jgi:hypothetical protein
MWDSDGPLVQVEIGSAISTASNEPDGRGALAKVLGAPAPPRGKRFIEATQSVRSRLRSEGILLPLVNIREEALIPPDSAVFYIGIERRAARFTHIDQVPLFIGQRVSDLARPPLDRAAARTMLAEALSCVAADSYQDAFERYCRVYYQGAIADFGPEITRSLYDTAGICLRDGDLVFATALLGRAYQLSHTQAIVDAALKAQIALALANVLRLMNDRDGAAGYYRQAASGAYYCGNAMLLFLALMGAAEVKYHSAEYADSAILLENARELVSSIPAGQPFELAYHVERSINAVLTNMLRAPKRSEDDLFAALKHAILTALAQSLTSSLVCKLFPAAGGLSLSVFGLAYYNLKGSIFRGVTAVGENIVQNL